MLYGQAELPLNLELPRTSVRRVLTTVTGYLERPILSPDKLIALFSEWLPAFKRAGCDTIIGRGMSGALAVSLLGRHFGLHWAVVRKDGEYSHSQYRVEGTIGRRWLFVDDLTSSGDTMRSTVARVQEHCRSHIFETELCGAWLYQGTPIRYYTVEALDAQFGLPTKPEPLPEPTYAGPIDRAVFDPALASKHCRSRSFESELCGAWLYHGTPKKYYTVEVGPVLSAEQINTYLSYGMTSLASKPSKPFITTNYAAAMRLDPKSRRKPYIPYRP